VDAVTGSVSAAWPVTARPSLWSKCALSQRRRSSSRGRPTGFPPRPPPRLRSPSGWPASAVPASSRPPISSPGPPCSTASASGVSTRPACRRRRGR